MIRNQILHIKPNEINNIITNAKNNNYYIVTLDGRNIHNERDYLILAYEKFQFPVENPNYIYDSYLDWIRDLSWLIDKGFKGFGLIIDYYNSFLDQDPESKKYLNKEGFNDITCYWEHQILKVMESFTGEFAKFQKPRSFNIYLVDR